MRAAELRQRASFVVDCHFDAQHGQCLTRLQLCAVIRLHPRSVPYTHDMHDRRFGIAWDNGDALKPLSYPFQVEHSLNGLMIA
jgi:hypothetical protein